MKMVNSSSDARARAARTHESWHWRSPDRTDTWRQKYPEFYSPIGVAMECCYFSNKWGRECTVCGNAFVPIDPADKLCPARKGIVGKCGGRTVPTDKAFELYHHPCESEPKVYVASRTGIPVRDALRVNRNTFSTTNLGVADCVTVRLDAGGTRRMDFSNAVIESMPDRRTVLVVPSSGFPVIIRGGAFRVTRYGLAN